MSSAESHSKLWETFDNQEEVGSISTNNVNNATSSNDLQLQNRSTGTNNNNYVNFNEFIVQHNFHAGGDNLLAYSFPPPLPFGISTNSAMPPSTGINNSSRNEVPNTVNDIDQLNEMCSNHNTNQYNFGSIVPSSSNNYMDNGEDALSNRNNCSNFIQNPFANGVNFISSSNLHATAPEFVPRFKNLTLNETKTTSNKNGEFLATSEEQHRHCFRFKPPNSNEIQKLPNIDNNVTFGMADNEVKSNIKVQVEGGESKSTTVGNAMTNPSVFVSNSNTSSFPICNTDSQFTIGALENGQKLKHNQRNEKSARVERERERDNRRYQNSRRSAVLNEREDNYHRHRYENHRSNKRRDDWNRNRDRINGFRVEEKYSSDNAKDSPIPSPEKKLSPKKVFRENEKLSQREKFIRDITGRCLECLVCVEPIKNYHSAWSCNNCYHILHLQCIIKWATTSKSADGWRCPACQNVVKDVPRDYFCFCGKIKNPQYSRQNLAHSCGEICGRIEGCPHACTLLCHPGPCPPCQANVLRECGCEKTSRLMQCYLKDSIECNSVCDKFLNCEFHTCKENCHGSKCEPCTEIIDQKCHCGKSERQVTCARETYDKYTYSCGKPCNKDLLCGNHKCKDCCHPGQCRSCKLSPENVTTCPCGKSQILTQQRNSCLDAIPVCENVCGKTMRCGKIAHPHSCCSKCHLGNCPPCNKQTAVKCRCGHMDQMIKCRQLSTRADDVRCKKRCIKKRSCGKHKCNVECCIDIDHICPLPCNYTLSCGKHKCDLPCHRGNCPPCYRSSFEELYCECGAEVIYPPVPCGTKRPVCNRPCSRSHDCSHAPQHNCHSVACPPCMIFTTKWCFGQHEQRRTIPCSQDSFSCGFACNKKLPCGRHNCIKPCHEGSCQIAGEVCKQSCTTLRTTCGHKCLAACHEGDCPDAPCKEMVEVQCECGNRKQTRACHDLSREYSRIATAQLASSMAEMQRGNYMNLNEILAPVKSNKTLDCNEECRLLERNRRIAIGLQIRNPDLSQKLTTKYSDFIRNFAKRDPALVKSIHDSLTNLVKLAKESKQKFRSHSFPTMNREKRQLVHEMCQMFGVDSVAYDPEPNRNVVATAYKTRSWLPSTSVMDVMQREAGQRRVPVPTNNVWGAKK